jgi:hypothetical protein
MMTSIEGCSLCDLETFDLFDFFDFQMLGIHENNLHKDSSVVDVNMVRAMLLLWS